MIGLKWRHDRPEVAAADRSMHCYLEDM